MDTKSRSVGQSLVQMPALYDGCFCLDTSYTNVDGIAYSGINYLTHDSESIDSIPLFNRFAFYSVMVNVLGFGNLKTY